ncbi:MAG: 2'-5' RNA ligase family protein [Actinomycetia bacterium]|nr:2'-5' RNA ligase family protein [Actinomycetes bacterium]
MASSESVTVGVAVTVPDPWGEQLQEQRAGFGDSLAWTVPTHITLLPPTQVPARRLAQVDEHLGSVASGVAAFDVVLSGSATFRPVSLTSFVVVDQGARECERLADLVRTGPLSRSLTFPYHPHVTIAVDLSEDAHDRAEAQLADFGLEFSVARIERYELAEHGVWESVAEFPLLAARG